MTDDEKYLFDLQGYVVLKNALAPTEVDLCNEAIDHCRDHIHRRPSEQSLSGNSQTLKVGTLSYASKYLPGGVEEVPEEFTPQQRAILEPPYRPNRPSLL